MASSAAPSPSPQHAPVLALPARRIRLRGHARGEQSYSAPPTREELKQVCRSMISALDEERRAATSDVIQLCAGTRVEMVDGGSVYRIEATGRIDADKGDPALLRVAAREVDGVLLSCDAKAAELLLAEDVGDALPAGSELLLGAPWLVARLRERIAEAFRFGLTTPLLFNLTTALQTLGIGEIEVAGSGLVPQYENTTRPLNAEQERAVEVAFRAPLTVIASPGGTGKTLTLGALVEACYRAGLRTLVAAPSNVAVDLVMGQVCARLSGEPGFGEAHVLRVGSDVGADLRRHHGAEVVLDDVTTRLWPKLRERIEHLQGVVDSLAQELTAAQRPVGGVSRADVERIGRQLSSARAKLRRLRRQARDFARRLVSGARVVGSTLARVFLDPDLHGFDVVVVDEASMAQAPATFLAAGLARRHVIVAGDPFQLAAPVRSNGPNRHWLAVDVFERLDIIHAIRDEEDVPYLTQLVEQRRSAESICELQRTIWYGPSLRTAREVIARECARKVNIFQGSAICYLDTSVLRPRAYTPWGRTFANEEHARLIADLIAYIDSAGELPTESGDGSEILVLSHYRGQVAAIRETLGDRYRNRGVSVRTVHRAQGTEATTCVLDLTLSRHQPARTGSVFTAVGPHEDGSRLLAVAASRARSRFILVGDMEGIEASVAPNSVLGRLYSHLLEHGHAIPLVEIRPSARSSQLRVVR